MIWEPRTVIFDAVSGGCQTKAELIDRERQFHEVQPEGIILKFGTVVGFVVGVIILYQVLYSDVKICIPKILPCPLYRFLLDSRLPTPAKSRSICRFISFNSNR
ncbi:hypothetical protein [Chroococcidiopsis sp. CCNUC1]|uniref:hypothetical protein n=1 Tax=Chroococcidiopsis sp. CCNUC1 TaxID=2653189 RepID=UPI0020219186|nr:hypothetical protein [Chroococcidiopsis sp. CCNUC1]URD52705.1 hypothetical protein M5J74_12075 [Chroococcidiopsis sp. CCNUC1]